MKGEFELCFKVFEILYRWVELPIFSLVIGNRLCFLQIQKDYRDHQINEIILPENRSNGIFVYQIQKVYKESSDSLRVFFY